MLIGVLRTLGVRSALLTLMGLGADRDPLETHGVPTVLRAAPLSA